MLCLSIAILFASFCKFCFKLWFLSASFNYLQSSNYPLNISFFFVNVKFGWMQVGKSTKTIQSPPGTIPMTGPLYVHLVTWGRIKFGWVQVGKSTNKFQNFPGTILRGRPLGSWGREHPCNPKKLSARLLRWKLLWVFPYTYCKKDRS